MRKVNLTMEEIDKYSTIKKLVETDGNKKRAAIALNCSVRHINRMVKGYKESGKEFFIHGNRGRKPSHALTVNTKQLILDLYRTKYSEANFTHFSELLKKHHNITVSTSTIHSILIQDFILSPKAKRATRKRIKAELKELQKTTNSIKEIAEIQSSIIAAEDAHPRRPRCAYTGEMLQMDASVHLWFGNEKSQLHIAVDDATGAIMGAYFDPQETLNGYYHVLHQVLTDYGIPYMLFTDRRTVFEYKQKKSPSVEEDTFTQFSYACKQLGIEIRTSSVAQAKGRVERMFQTLQSRLPLEMRLAGINTIEQANEFLNSYIKEFNAQFALPVDDIKSVFEMQPDNEKINLTLAVLTSRKVDNGSCIKFKKNYYLPIDSNGHPVHYRKGTSGMVIQAFSDEIFLCVDEKVYALDLLPGHKLSSKNFDLVVPNDQPRKRYIPPMSHPWKQDSFERYLNKQAHRSDNVA
ncbi:ISNCY family transposase [Clostridium estertheticum]|uniref:ISNCY family transposase n=1 Tax=Clostridium estertheticum TaxID=238834 RepID=UPI001CC9ACBC|nr:ISNCY family transposase [Clostridium estertheticum]MBZ9606437.1 ISNCY family transposase [Clostridium estertheticum]MBZ9606649.1 ISNCY family transposase [Clostridium estertheticum]MBZ9606844.1 ISNCY family transposase [Clostridium estertheticum]MBZ9606846.1 ISNCY family transposase [Clostridium estertheticum]MBZ9607005.1 ISNCY family transposase [Clostridium estertheticum]